jgi:uncharacterized protein YdaL
MFRKLVRQLVLLAWLCGASWMGLAPAQVQAQTATPAKILVLYDTPSGTAWDKIGFAYAIMLRNLLGHFDAQVSLQPVQQYAAGAVNNYDATFYLGSAYDFQLPPAFLSDAVSTAKTLVWFKYNLWELAWNSAYNFSAARGISFSGLRGMNALPSAGNPSPGFFDTIQYKNLSFVKYYAWDSAHNVINADPDTGITAITDPTKATTVVSVLNAKTGETAPYVVRSGHFWYVADLPLSYIGPRDRYLVLADLLHDMLGINHAESHRAMIRLEDVNAWTTVTSMKTLSDYLYGKKIPFSIATIPHFRDGLGIYNNGVPLEIPLAQASNLRKELNYALPRGGEVVMHGYTHQYDSMRNPNDAVSGDDYEFWNIVANTPVAEDSPAWALGRLQAGVNELHANGYTPVAWEMPHYEGSANACRAVPQVFPTTYQRVVYFTADKPNFTAAVAADLAVGQFYPYAIGKDYYGQRVLPEDLGNFEYDLTAFDPTANVVYTWQDILTNAQYAMAVRDGFGSFFFHPFLLEPDYNLPALSDLQKLVTAMTGMGYTWVSPSMVK